MRAFGYIRVSTVGQAERGYSLDYQRSEIEKYCRENKLELVEIFEDAGVSGATYDDETLKVARDGINRMMSAWVSERIEVVVVLNTNRLWREEVVKALVKQRFRKDGIEIKSIEQSDYTLLGNTSPVEELINGVLEVLDLYQRREVVTKLKNGRKEKASRGRYAGGRVAFGYRWDKNLELLTIDEREAEIIREVFRLRGNGKKKRTLKEIAEYLNSKGYVTNRGKPFGAVMIKRILDKGDFYRGIYRYSGIESKGNYDPIL